MKMQKIKTRMERTDRRHEVIWAAAVLAFLALCVVFCAGFVGALEAAAW